VAKDNFSALVDDLAELDRRKRADAPILKALRAANAGVRQEAAAKAVAESARRQDYLAKSFASLDQANLRKSIDTATDLLKAAVSAGRLTALEACSYEAQIHRMAGGLR
jgi:hypothetical protein